MNRSRPRPRRAPVLAVLVVALGALPGCGSNEEESEGGGDPSSPAPFSLSQTALSGSFLGSDEELELVLRGVGGATELGAEASGGGGSAGALPNGAFPRLAEQLLGPEPYRATLAGAEVGAQRYALELRQPRYDGVLGTLRYEATVVGGAPERPPASFGAATLTLGSSLDGGTLTGSASDEGDGEPLGGALIEVRLGRLGLLTALSDDDGSFRAGPLAPGEYRVVASLAGYERAAGKVSLPATEPLELELAPFLVQPPSG